MLEEIFFEIGLGVVITLIIGLVVTTHEFKKYVLRKKNNKKK